jgi:hypothetical protein
MKCQPAIATELVNYECPEAPWTRTSGLDERLISFIECDCAVVYKRHVEFDEVGIRFVD